jgi:hypothetical protein
MRGRPTLAIALLAGLAAVGAACFSPQKPACAFACGPGGACPDDYVCASDGLCHRQDESAGGHCDLDPVNGSAPDGAAD